MRLASRSLPWLLAALAVASCSRAGRPAPAAGATARPAAASATLPSATGTGVVAEVNGAPVLLSELDERAAARLVRVRQEEFEIRKQALDELIAEKLLDGEAAKLGISREELVRREIEAKARQVDPTQVEAIYEQNKERFAGQPREQTIARIRQAVGQRARDDRRAAYEGDLRRQAKIAVSLEPPRARLEIPAGAPPAQGPAGAAVTLVEFTDYQCPFCHRAQGVIDQVLRAYEGKVRFVHLDFPLDGHPGAFPAARAARCAAEQGRFWEYHRDLMLEKGALDDADLRARAGRLKLDVAAFGVCLLSGRHDEAIRASFLQGESLGVTGTPAYFVNGRMLSGARPYQDFADVIDAELGAR